MTDRQREILFAIIEEYAELATPVGSVTLAKRYTTPNRLAIKQLEAIVQLCRKINEKKMSVYIRIIRNNIKSSRSYGK